MLKRLLLLLALFAPALALGFFTLFPAYDLSLAAPLAHFYIVTFITFAAVVISILLAASLGAQAQARHVLAATAFAVIGSIFFSHGLATPGALIATRHPAVSWSAWLTLFASGVLFVLASFDHPRAQRRFPVAAIVWGTLIFVVFYSSVAAFAPGVLTAIQERTDPLQQKALFFISLVLWVVAAVRLGLIWRLTRNPVDGMLAFVAVWLIVATVSMHQFPVWRLSWWVYHLDFLLSFIITAVVLARAYEKVRQFQLLRYYLAAALIFTALLALAASALFTEFAFTTVVADLTGAARTQADNVTMSLATDLSDVTTAEALQTLPSRPGMKNLLARRLSGLDVQAVYIYDATGLAVYADPVELIGVRANDLDTLHTVLHGETVVALAEPSNAPTTYGPSNAVYRIEAYAPLYPGGDVTQPALGMLALVEEAPEISAATLRARATGLVTAASTMGALMLLLLIVVSRADRILTQRTEELRKVTGQLQTYSEWLLGRDLLRRLLADPNALGLSRRERTVLFMDIRGFTAWSETRSPEEVVAMLNRYYNLTEGVLTRHQAIKFKFAADEAMAVFAEPLSAVAAARELREQITILFADFGLGAGIGVHTGPLVEGLLGSLGVKFYDAIGDTVNTTKRIESAATGGEVLLSAATWAFVQPTITVGPHREITAKGKEELVMVYPLL